MRNWWREAFDTAMGCFLIGSLFMAVLYCLFIGGEHV